MRKKPRKSHATSRQERTFRDESIVAPTFLLPWVEILLLVALIGFTVLLFFGSLSADFTFDDFEQFVENPKIHNWEFRSDPWWGWHIHVRALTFMIDWSLFGDSPTGYHVHNLLWHVLCVLLLYVLVKGLSNRVSTAFLVALLFATHPIHTEVVTNITNRKELLSLAFMLAASLCYGRFIESVEKKRLVWFTTAVVAWILALFSVQFAIALPLYLVAYEFHFVPQEKRFLLKNPLLLVGGFIAGTAIVLTYTLTRAINLEDLHDSGTFKGYAGVPTLYSVWLTTARAFWRYVGLLIWPDELCPDQLVALSRSLLEPTTLLAWVGLIALMAGACLLARRPSLLSFGLFCFLFSYIPISNILPTVYIMADRYMYISSAAFCIVLVSLGEVMYHKLHGFQPRLAAPVMGILGGLLIAGYSLKVLSYNPHWKNERTLWTYTLRCNPQSFRAYNNLGYQHLKAGDYAEAIELLSQSIKRGYKKAYEHRGTAYLGIKDYEAAIQDYNHAIAYKPDWDTIYYDRGLVYFEMGQYEKAIGDFSRAIELKPDYSTAYNNRGLAYENLNRRDEALEDYVKATELDPDNGAAHNNLGRALVYAGRLKEAIHSYQRAEKLGVTHAKKILEILNKQGLPNGQGSRDPSGTPSINKDKERLHEPSPN